MGSNKLEAAIYYPTLNKANARSTEDITLSDVAGDIGVSKITKKLTDIKNECYYIDKLDKVHTKTYDVKTGKDIQKEIIHMYWSTLGPRSFGVNINNVIFDSGRVYSDNFYSGNFYIGGGGTSLFTSYGSSLSPRPVVFLSSTNKYYKEQGSSKYETYSLIKEEESQHLKIQNPYNVSLNNVNLKGTYADRLLFESKLDESAQNVAYTNLTRADGTKVIDNIIYTVEGLPEGITYDVVKKEVSGKEEVTIQIYPKEIRVVANVNKKDIYSGAKFSYNILLNRNGTKVSSKALNETADGKIEIAKYTEKKDMIDEKGNKIVYTLDYDNFNDTVRKDNTYYNNTFAKSSKSNNNKIIYNLGIVYNKAKYEEDQKKETDITDKKENSETEKEKDKDKKHDVEEDGKKRTELINESNNNNKENNTKNSTNIKKIPYAGRKVSLPIIGVLLGVVYSVVTKKKMLNIRNIAI